MGLSAHKAYNSAWCCTFGKKPSASSHDSTRKTTVSKMKKAKIVSSEYITNVTVHRGTNFLNDYDEAEEEERR